MNESNDGKLTADEHAVLNHLVDAWNAFNELPVQHPAHKQEFTQAIHQLQRLVMSRPTSRAEGWVKVDGSDVPSPNQKRSHIRVLGDTW